MKITKNNKKLYSRTDKEMFAKWVRITQKNNKFNII